MLLSMTGYGKAEKKASNFDISVQLKSINSRYVDIVSRVDDSIFIFENDILSLIKKKCIRGKIYLNITLNENSQSSKLIKLNKNKLKCYMEQTKLLQKELNTKETLNIEFLLKQPDIFIQDLVKRDKKIILSCVNDALSKLLDHRKKEGKIIEKDILSKIKIINTDIKKIIRLSNTNIPKELKKIKNKIDTILPNFDLNSDRLYQEVAIILEKKDINEEISRLNGHMGLLIIYLKDNSISGKKINFLLQELNREINTIGSKIDNLKIRHLVVNIKNNIEMIKEQIQNII